MTHTTSHTITRGDIEIELEVEYEVARYYPARGPSFDSPGEPAEGGEITSMTATLDGEPFALTDEEERQIEARIYETHDYSEGDYFDGY